MSASPEMKLNVANYFIKSAPINEVKFALNDVKTILNDSQLFNNTVQSKMLHDYNVNHYVHVDDGNGNKFILTPFNEVNQNTFYNPENNKVYELNHIEKQVVSEVGTHTPNGNESFRVAVTEAMKKYISENYKKDKCVFGVYYSGNDLVLCISAINTNLGAFWTGNWRATYKLAPGATNITGKLEVNVHYFEDGNVQLNAAFEPTENTEVNASNADSIVSAIKKIESEWQANIEKMYVNMHHQTMKAMRRALPISKTLFNWSSQAHALARELNK